MTVLASLVVIAFLTLRPAEAFDTLPAGCVFCGQLGGVDFVLNIALFVPLGIGLRWLTRNRAVTVSIGIATTLAIETSQWRFIPGRDASLGDLLANTIGTMVGAWLAVEGIRWLNAARHESRRLAGVFGIVVSAMVVGSSWLLQPLQVRYPQWVQWKPVRRSMDHFQGQLSSVDFNGATLRPAEILREREERNTRTVSMRARVSGGIPPTRRQAYIVRIANSLEEGFALLQWGHSAVFRSHMAASNLKLRPLLVALENGLPGSGGGSDEGGGELTIEALGNSRALVLSVIAPAAKTSTTLRRTVGLAWAILLPWDVALNERWWPANAAWLGALVFPVAFFTMRSWRKTPDDSSRGMAWWPLSLVLAVLVSVPALTGLSALSVGEWSGVLAGMAAGAGVERWFAPTSART